MQSKSQFVQQVKEALKHLYDYSYLESHPLALQYRPDAGRGPGLNRGQRLSRLLLESIEELHPPAGPAKDTYRAQCYFLLVYRYVEEWPLADIMRELGYSRRQFFRKQQRAIALLATVLQDRLGQQTTSPTGSGNMLEAEAERVLAQSEAVDLAEMTRGILAAISQLAEQHSVTLEYDPDPRLPPIRGSRTLLRQVFLKASSDLITHHDTQRVHLQMYRDRQRVMVKLVAERRPSGRRSDTGEGWLSPDAGQLSRLVELAGGQWRGLKVTSGRCTCRFDFPTHDQKTLLVIEDNEAVIRAFSRYLSGYGFQVVGATTGAEALQVAREMNPTAITLDVLMPTQDGWEILQVLKSDPATKDIPVIICSVLEEPKLALSLGATAYLLKPVSQADLLSALSSVPRLRQR